MRGEEGGCVFFQVGDVDGRGLPEGRVAEEQEALKGYHRVRGGSGLDPRQDLGSRAISALIPRHSSPWASAGNQHAGPPRLPAARPTRPGRRA